MLKDAGLIDEHLKSFCDPLHQPPPQSLDRRLLSRPGSNLQQMFSDGFPELGLGHLCFNLKTLRSIKIYELKAHLLSHFSICWPTLILSNRIGQLSLLMAAPSATVVSISKQCRKLRFHVTNPPPAVDRREPCHQIFLLWGDHLPHTLPLWR